VLVRNNIYTGGLSSAAAAFDTYIVQSPIPGVAFYYGQHPAGVIPTITTPLLLNAVRYADAASLFPVGSENDNVTEFRFAGMAIELVSTMNDMTWLGSLLTYKTRIALSITAGQPVAGSLLFSGSMINGMDSILPIQSSNNNTQALVTRSKEGVYAPSYNGQPDWRFMPILENQQTAFAPPLAPDLQPAMFTGGVVGVGDLVSTVIVIPAAATVQNFIVRAWQKVEYKVNTNSVLYPYSHDSPSHDPVALALYRKMAKDCPLAVPAADNANFWQTLLSIVGAGGSALAGILPGPFGLLAGGVGGLASLLSGRLYPNTGYG
jgi:hypothetical protein